MSSYSLPDLPYGYDALEPHFDARTMEIHHSQVHRQYVDQLNSAMAAMGERSAELRAVGDQPVEDLLWSIGKIPEEYRNAIRNYGGGHANHSLFWSILSPDGGGKPVGAIGDAITQQFGNFSTFKNHFAALASGHVGSGWVWAIKVRDTLVAYTMPNEDSPLTAGETPVLGLDLWEHSYYLQYPGRRGDYVEAFWNLVNWEEVNRRFESPDRR